VEEKTVQPRRRALIALCAVLLSAALLAPPINRASSPYAPSRDYDLQNVRTHLWFNLEQRKIRGEVSHSLSLLRDDLAQLRLDSVDLNIRSVSLDGADARFATTPNELIVFLPHPGKRGERHELFIRYDGQPKKGLYFILPDKSYPQRAKEIWTQGETEDTRYYIPIYDYPNDRMTSEMLLTVPAGWTTVSNGRLVGVNEEPDGTKTWDWKQEEPLSSYLISVVAGEFAEKNDTWRGMPLRYLVPRGEEYKISPTFSHTKEMLEVFSSKLGVPYPWAQYAQSSVDDFIEGGMENTSASTLTTKGLIHPKLAPEERNGSDDLTAHELAHQWFGDLVTCKDWGNIWLNEGFATYFEHLWAGEHYGAEEAAYQFWRDQSDWFAEKALYSVPLVTHDYPNMDELEGNIYTKGGWVLKMLRTKLGDAGFFRSLHVYLETNRGQNVVTADLQKAIEQATSTNVDKFFHQWVYRAGAPRFEVSYTYDNSSHRVTLNVKQTQKAEGLVDIFDVPVEIEIATAGGPKTYPIEVSDANAKFTLTTDGPPLMVIFDKGDNILKTLEFKRSAASLVYQLKNAETVPDRADAAAALAEFKSNGDVVAALGAAARKDPFWGVRAEALKSLGKIGGEDAEAQILQALSDSKPWVREVAVAQLGNLKEDPSLVTKLTEIAAGDDAYSVRGAALKSLAALKAPNAFETLSAVVKSDSPEDVLRASALRALGVLGDDRAIPILLDWAALGRPLDTRGAAIFALARLDKQNKELTKTLLSYLNEPYFDVKFATFFALGARGDPEALPILEGLLKSGELSDDTALIVEEQIEAIEEAVSTKQGGDAGPSSGGQEAAPDVGGKNP
jgi:aminopeptidase N